MQVAATVMEIKETAQKGKEKALTCSDLTSHCARGGQTLAAERSKGLSVVGRGYLTVE